MAAMLRLIGLLLSICGALSLHGRISRECLNCKDTTHPSSCTTLIWCPEECKTDVYFLNGRYVYSFGCNEPEPHHHETCTEVHVPVSSTVLGKRDRHHEHEEGTLVCRECCSSGTSCNKNGCLNYGRLTTTTTTTTTTTPMPTTPMPTTQTTTTPKPVNYDPDCHDSESETFKCADLNKFNFCHDASSLAHALAYDKCPLFCGLCHPSWATTKAPLTTAKLNVTDVPVTAGPCADNEVQGFSCAEWKGYGFCSSQAGSGYNIAKERCQKTCGFCSSD